MDRIKYLMERYETECYDTLDYRVPFDYKNKQYDLLSDDEYISMIDKIEEDEHEDIYKIALARGVIPASNKFTDFFTAYHFLKNHQIVEGYFAVSNNRQIKTNYFNKCLTMDVVKINPETNMIDEIDENNTKTEIWLEFGPWDIEDSMPIHDHNLDCGADTYEEAIITLANLVRKHYNNDGSEILYQEESMLNNKDMLLSIVKDKIELHKLAQTITDANTTITRGI